MEHLKCRPIGLTLALSSNIRLGWKALPGTNTLAYYENSQITAVKSFLTLAPGVSIFNLSIMIKTHKLGCFFADNKHHFLA